MNGADLVKGKWTRYVIDFYGLTEGEARRYGIAYQHLYDRVMPERQINREARTSKQWWLFRRSGEQLRGALVGLSRFIGTTRTAKHRVFQFMPSNVIAESKIVVIASSDAYLLGVLSSYIHVAWALATGCLLYTSPSPRDS